MNLTKSETLSVDPTKYYRVTEDTKLAWRYDFKSLSIYDTLGNSLKEGNAAILYGSEVNPEAVFVNAKSSDKHNLEGDAALAQNKLKAAP